jgi:DNA processing protein
MDERALLDLIISRLPGLSSPERICLCEKFDREEDLIKNSKRDIEIIIRRIVGEAWNMDRIRAQAEEDAKKARLRGIGWVSCVSPDYPSQLRQIYDPPALLFFRGRLPDPAQDLAAIVGTRRPSQAAAAQAFDIARGLGQQGIPVISGLALGIDAMAHRGNLEGGGPSIAVLGSGPDEIYPRTNRFLAGKILEKGGAILSEYPPGTGPRKWNFPARNRIISALARGVLIVEAPAVSGALITADFALEQGRDLWVASVGTADYKESSGAPYDRRGTAKLAEEGAKVIRSAADILREWNWKIESEEHPGWGQLTEQCGGISGGRALAASLARSLDIEL